MTAPRQDDVSSAPSRASAGRTEIGAWTGHNIALSDGSFTLGPEPTPSEFRLRQVLQLAADFSHRDLREARVLDLGCDEGGFAIEFAHHGAEVLGIDARPDHIARARWVADDLRLEHASFAVDDVRNVSLERYGEFDVVLCLGLLYHLDAPDVFDVAHNLAEICSGVLILDTQIALRASMTSNWRDFTYRGRRVPEHRPGSSPEQKLGRSRASIDNPMSFWPTRPSLCNLLADVGFSAVAEARMPRRRTRLGDRILLVAVKGIPLEPRSSPPLTTRERWPERERLRASPRQRPLRRLESAIRRILRADS